MKLSSSGLVHCAVFQHECSEKLLEKRTAKVDIDVKKFKGWSGTSHFDSGRGEGIGIRSG